MKNYTNIISYKQEIYRKLLHIISLWIPLSIVFLDYKSTIILFSTISIIMIGMEILRRRDNSIKIYFNKYFGLMLREHEKSGNFSFTGSTYIIIATLICILFFSKIISILAITITLISDACASLVGRKFGKTKIYFGKTAEGSAAFFFSGIIILIFITLIFNQNSYFFYCGIFSMLITTLAELFSKKIGIDDNLFIPIMFSFSMYLLL